MSSHFKKKKSLGQNFLKSKTAVRAMVSAGAVVSGDLVLEIGPGQGVLTRELLGAGAKVMAIEKDDRLIPVLSETFREEIEAGQLSLVHGDVLELDPARITKGNPYKLIANIPYYITGALFRMFLETDHQPETMVLLVQKEVAERIVARDKKESVLSLSVKAYGMPKIERKVPKTSFSPAPKVDSAILSIRRISKDFFAGISEEEFFLWIKAGFAHKRKKLIKNLEVVCPRETLEQIFLQARIDSQVRAEDLSLEDWGTLLDTDGRGPSRRA